MYQTNDAVGYGSDGLCLITAIVTRSVEGRRQQYYELHPVFRSDSVIYLPVDGPRVLEKLRPALSRDRIMELIRSIREHVPQWIERDTARKTIFQEALREGNPEQLLTFLHALYRHRGQLRARGKRLHTADEAFLHEAERILFDEFAYVLNIPRSEVPAFLAEQGLS